MTSPNSYAEAKAAVAIGVMYSRFGPPTEHEWIGQHRWRDVVRGLGSFSRPRSSAGHNNRGYA